MTENKNLAEGDLVTVIEPYQDSYSRAWLLPGEQIYVLAVPQPTRLIPSRRARVRCPASGADMWIHPALLVPYAADTSDAALDRIVQKVVDVLDERTRSANEKAFADEMSRGLTSEEAVEVLVRSEFSFRIKTVAAYAKARGKHGEKVAPEFIQREIDHGVQNVLARLTAGGVSQP